MLLKEGGGSNAECVAPAAVIPENMKVRRASFKNIFQRGAGSPRENFSGLGSGAEERLAAFDQNQHLPEREQEDRRTIQDGNGRGGKRHERSVSSLAEYGQFAGTPTYIHGPRP